MDDELEWQGELPCPSFTMVPDVVFDVLLPRLSGGEWKVLAYLIRQTYGWHRRRAQVPLEEICAGAGVSRRTAVEALRAFEGRGLVAIGRSVTRFGKEQNTYELCIASDPKYSEPKSKKYPSQGQKIADVEGQKVAVPSSSTTDKRTERAIHPARARENGGAGGSGDRHAGYAGGRYGVCAECGARPCCCP